MSMSRFLLGIIAYVCIAIGTVGGALDHIAHKSGSHDTSAYIYIPPGSGLLRISWLLKNQGVISVPWHFEVISTLNGMNSRLRAGEFEIKAHASVQEILSIITEGQLYKRLLVIPEGLSNLQIEAIIDAAPGLDLVGALPPEGYILPDTYFYHYGTKASDFFAALEIKMNQELDALWIKRPENFPIKSKHDLLTLASIVEKETGLAGERHKVAAVFLNRLKRGMRLQSDPTVIYGITQGLPLDRRIKSSDLKADTAYNTYRIRGLPPGPIANPGRASIEAVIFAEPAKYLYFVADGSGGHAFAASLAEHNKNVRQWRKIRDAQ